MWRDPPGGGYKKPIHVVAMLLLAVILTLTTVISAEDASMGPVFVKEPPNRIDFSNGTGAVVECQARGNPQPDIIWVRSDGNTAVGDVPGLRQVMPNGNLVFPPFRAEDYRQEVHAQVYTCLARSPAGSVHSRDVNVRAVVAQYYDTDVNKEYAIRGNSAILKCVVPSFVADFVKVLSWHTDQGEEFVPGDDFGINRIRIMIMVHQYYQSEVNNEYVIRGNAAILKCSIPSFVAEFVQVIGWQDDQGNSFDPDQDNVVTQYYEAEVVSEYVIRGNAAILKCTIPSFVAEFVSVESWVGSDGSTFRPSTDYVVTQPYNPEILTEYVIRGNSAILKCSIPSYIAEFVTVEAWIREDGEVYLPTDLTVAQVVSQFYVTEAENEYVIRANSAIMKCKIPSFVSEFVQVDQWVADDGTIYTSGQEYVVQQFYETRVIDEFVLRGNTATLKCLVPSFVADFVDVIEWQDEDGSIYTVNSQQEKDGKYLVLPSGELHIRDVGPEDGYKTYQCRTKHRLTGETRLSATKGRLVITEPIGSVRPKFPTIDDSRSFRTTKDGSVTLLCPAQGFPVPLYKTIVELETKINGVGREIDKSVCDIGLHRDSLVPRSRVSRASIQVNCSHQGHVIAEPIASTKPKFPMTENSRTYTTYTVQREQPLTLSCPAQAFPVPNYRYIEYIKIV
ncbi:hypothetical protein ALC53_10967 [Atta colombica]|uniref:Ig-like domain-containing protein n=1 Tax=Atta colombica TaxID=520822 RepID=A0A195B1Z6_9HYME|nr:hypothetical protein ALC53_10967 [Atta colombica]